MFSLFNNNKRKIPVKQSFIYLLIVVCTFCSIVFLTSIQPAYRLSSNTLSSWTSEIDSAVFINLIRLENRSFNLFDQDGNHLEQLPETILQLVTSIRPYDFRSLLGNEFPGFTLFNQEILIAGEGTDFTTLPVESSFPLEDVLTDKKALVKEGETSDETKDGNIAVLPQEQTVFLYNTHNRESYLPHLPDVTNPNDAHHSEVNVTLVSDYLEKSLAEKGIGAMVDKTDIIGDVLVNRGWKYWQSYDVSREVVSSAFSSHQDLKYAFDIHRDSIERTLTTKQINGVDYARIMFVIGKDNPSFEQNYQLAKTLHEGLEAKYPGLSRGVVPQGGAGKNGVYNQDLSEQALLLEVGGVDNTLEEAYRTADAFAEVFSNYYWDAEPVQGN